MDRLNTSASLPPGPAAGCDLEQVDDKLGTLLSLYQTYGDIYRLRSTPRAQDTYVINRPDWIRRVLVNRHRNYTKGAGIGRVRVLLGNGLMTSEGQCWQQQRRMMQPLFQKTAVETWLPVFQQQAALTREDFLRHAGSATPLNISTSMSELTLKVMLYALFSDDFETWNTGQGVNPFMLASRDTRRDVQFAVRFRSLGRLVGEIVEQRRRARRYPADLLTALLRARDRSSGQGMTDKQLVDEVLTLIVAGHETTAAALTWFWYLFARHPRTATRITAEVRCLGVSQPLNLQQLESLSMTTCMIRETLRLYPPGWLFSRRAIQSDRFGAYHVPAGTDVLVCTWLLHRHPRFWSDAGRFDPGRFAVRAGPGYPKDAYLPFSAGPRHCIGESFAMAEMLTVISVLAAQFQLQPVSDTPAELEADVNLRPKQDVYLRVQLRD